jgi:hypothetical protein
MKLNKEDWNQLDKLLSKVGFGGYYDLCECIKMSINDILKNRRLKLSIFFIKKNGKDITIKEIIDNNDLHSLVLLLNKLSHKLYD